MKVVGYARVSTDRQKENATIKTQIDLIKKYCEKHDFTLVDFYIDDGVSGTVAFAQRPDGGRLMAAAKRGEFEAVVVYKSDRIGREVLVNETVVKELHEELGIRLLGVAENIDVTTPMGRTMFAVQSAFGSMERHAILQRSLDATIRYAEEGVWLGGLVPYGYRVEGKKKEARLKLSIQPIPEIGLSEVEVVQKIYHWAAHDGESCFVIADKLNAMGVPTSYTRDEREVLTNKRKKQTANLWRAGRVRNMIVETYYKGIHRWGKRQKKCRPHEVPRPIIERQVPAIVDEDVWDAAQATLTKNRLMSSRNSKRQYLLRGKMKCGLCGLTYGGTVSRGAKIENATIARSHPTYEEKGGYLLRPYYCCNGKTNHRGIYGQSGQRCPSRSVSSQIIEQAVWKDIEIFLRNPQQVLDEIQLKLSESSNGTAPLKKEMARFQRSLDGIEAEKDRVLGLYRKGIIDEETVASQLQVVETNKANLRVQVGHIEAELKKLVDQQHQCQTTQELLERLNGILDGELTFEVKREVVDALVEGIRVDTYGDGNKKSATVTVSYRFEKPEADSGSMTLTETGEDVRAGICLAGAKVSAAPARARARTSPAPARRPRLEGI